MQACVAWARAGADSDRGAVLRATKNARRRQVTGYQEGTYSGSTYGSSGYNSTHGTYSGTTYSPGAAASAQMQADAQNQQLIDRARQVAADNRQALQDRAMRANTLSPGEFIGGQITIELPDQSRRNAAPLELTLVAGMDQFKFKLTELFD